MTEIKDVSLRVICQTLLKFGKANLKVWGSIILKNLPNFPNPKTLAASNWPLSIDCIAPLKTSVEYAPEIIPMENAPVIKAFISIYSLYPNIESSNI